MSFLFSVQPIFIVTHEQLGNFWIWTSYHVQAHFGSVRRLRCPPAVLSKRVWEGEQSAECFLLKCVYIHIQRAFSQGIPSSSKRDEVGMA